MNGLPCFLGWWSNTFGCSPARRWRCLTGRPWWPEWSGLCSAEAFLRLRTWDGGTPTRCQTFWTSAHCTWSWTLGRRDGRSRADVVSALFRPPLSWRRAKYPEKQKFKTKLLNLQMERRLGHRWRAGNKIIEFAETNNYFIYSLHFIYISIYEFLSYRERFFKCLCSKT